MPRVVRSGGVLVVNPGSVGMPAYTDDNPVPHAIETGAPHARYAVVTRRSDGCAYQLCHPSVLTMEAAEPWD